MAIGNGTALFIEFKAAHHKIEINLIEEMVVSDPEIVLLVSSPFCRRRARCVNSRWTPCRNRHDRGFHYDSKQPCWIAARDAPKFFSINLAGLAKRTKEDFTKVWAHHRAARSVMGGIRIRSAMNHLAAGSHAAARSDLEYIRDHFDCGVPYLHQMIGMLAGTQQDEVAKGHCDGTAEGVRAGIRRSSRFFSQTASYRNAGFDEEFWNGSPDAGSKRSWTLDCLGHAGNLYAAVVSFSAR